MATAYEGKNVKQWVMDFRGTSMDGSGRGD